MDDLTARLEALFRRHAASIDPHQGVAAFDRLSQQLRKEIDLVIAEFGQAAVDAALDDMPDEPWPSVSLH
jgi:hypothetical protein